MNELMNQLESLKHYCQAKSTDTNEDLVTWLGRTQAVDRAIFLLKCLYCLNALSCSNCVHSGINCDCSSYLGQTGRIAGDDWCENYFPVYQ